EQPQIPLAVKVSTWLRRVRLHHATSESPQTCRVTPRIKIDTRDQSWLYHRRTEAQMVEVGHTDAVQEVSDVAGRSASHVEERQSGCNGRHAGQCLHSAERVADRTRDLSDFLSRVGRDGRLWCLTSNQHVDRGVLSEIVFRLGNEA